MAKKTDTRHVKVKETKEEKRNENNKKDYRKGSEEKTNKKKDAKGDRKKKNYWKILVDTENEQRNGKGQNKKQNTQRVINKKLNKNNETQMNIRIGNWNVRSIIGKEEEIVEEMIKFKVDIMAITETKKKGKGIKRIHKGYWMYWSGVENKERAKGGIGVIISPERIKHIIREEYVNERIMVAEINLTEKETWTLIIAYGENEDAKKEDKDKFYQALQLEIDNATKNVIVLGDLNGRVGNQNEGIEEIMGKEGETTRNNNGHRIIQLCVENNLIIANTKFKHKNIHKITRVQPSRGEASIIDYFLIGKGNWKNIKNVKVTRNAEIGSDHYLVLMDMRIKNETKTDQRRKIIKEKIRTYKLKEEKYRRYTKKY